MKVSGEESLKGFGHICLKKHGLVGGFIFVVHPYLRE